MEWRAILTEFRVIPAIFIAEVAFHFIMGYLTSDPRIYRTQVFELLSLVVVIVDLILYCTLFIASRIHTRFFSSLQTMCLPYSLPIFVLFLMLIAASDIELGHRSKPSQLRLIFIGFLDRFRPFPLSRR